MDKRWRCTSLQHRTIHAGPALALCCCACMELDVGVTLLSTAADRATLYHLYQQYSLHAAEIHRTNNCSDIRRPRCVYTAEYILSSLLQKTVHSAIHPLNSTLRRVEFSGQIVPGERKRGLQIHGAVTICVACMHCSAYRA